VNSNTVKTNLSAYRQIWRLLTLHPLLFAGLGIASLCVVLSESLGLGLVLPLLDSSAIEISFLDQVPILASLSQAVNNLTLTQNVCLAAAALVAIAFVRGVFSYISQSIALLLRSRIEQGVQSQVFRQLHVVELKFIYGERMGNLLTILGHYTYQVGLLILNISNAFVSLFTVAIYAILMALISWQLTFAAMGLLLCVAIVVRKQFSERIKQVSTGIRENIKRLRVIGVESLSSMKLLHLLSQEKQSIARFEAALGTYHSDCIRAGRLIALTQPLFNLLNALVLGALLISSTFLLSGQAESWLGQMAIFLAIAFRLMTPASHLAQVQAQVTQQHPILQSVLELVNQKDKPCSRNGHIQFETLEEGIRLENVTFRYDVDETDVLRDISFDIPRGTMTAVVGASGAGKSTLVNLIARLYECDNGRIMIDDTDLRDLDIASWRSRIAVVSQDTFIFNDTVWANLRLAKESATKEEIHLAAQLAQAHDFVTALPRGYDTLLGDQGVRLSGGQRQRIAIARAILVDPQLLILDEATSELDSETECAIQAAITRYGRERTVLVIAHRLSAIRHADNIVVLDQGQIVEQGTHQGLMRQGEHYWQLIQAQNIAKVRSQVDDADESGRLAVDRTKLGSKVIPPSEKHGEISS
jgi:subfamily B ATP-binding cassette protein MsbA